MQQPEGSPNTSQQSQWRTCKKKKSTKNCKVQGTKQRFENYRKEKHKVKTAALRGRGYK